MTRRDPHLTHTQTHISHELNAEYFVRENGGENEYERLPGDLPRNRGCPAEEPMAAILPSPSSCGNCIRTISRVLTSDLVLFWVIMFSQGDN